MDAIDLGREAFQLSLRAVAEILPCIEHVHTHVAHAVAQFLGGESASGAARPAIFIVEPGFHAEAIGLFGAGVD